jgi:TolA-binding protein
MQFQIKRLEEQLRKFQQDVDFRFDELKTAKPAARPAPATPAPAPAAPAAPARKIVDGFQRSFRAFAGGSSRRL